MGEGIQLGLSLMVIGMITVFSILFLVVACGALLIKITNKYFPIETQKTVTLVQGSNKNKIAAIMAAVEVATGGKGKATSIRKIN